MRLDWTILHEIRAFLTCPLLDMLMPKITMLGNSGAVWILAAGGLLCTKKYRKYGIILLAGLAMGVLVGNVFLKHLIARPRPCWLDQSVPLLIAVQNDYSFPSGHTLASVIGATILTAADRRFGIIAIPLAILIAFSRLYLYVHFPSDILGAVILENPSLKDIGYVLGVQPFDCTPFYNASLDFADKTVKNFNFLFSGAIFMLDSFVNENLFNQSI